jgi:predicted ATPase/DNA-binding SARP family transcriptional activator/DNA-binding CsgD family transcriptional regulator
MTQRRSATRARHGYDGVEAVRVWLLGGFRVSVGSRTIEASGWRLKKAAGLVKLLALAPGHRLHRERVMDVLWPDLDAKSAANNLHRVLHFARGALEPDAENATPRYLSLQGELLALCPEGPLWVDVDAFEEAARTARRSREPAACRAAVELYAGELLPEDRYEPWAEERREALRETYLALLVELARLHEEREEYAPAIETLRLALVEDPARERAHAGLMRLYALSGRRQEAILQYGRLRQALSEELGAEPGAESRRLYEEILADRYPSPPKDRASKEPAGTGHNLPASRTSFVGRAKEMVGVKRALAMTGVLTLTGTGGCGKTRLALEVARDLVGTYPDGVWLVELAPLSDSALVPQAVAAALGVREQPGRSLTETLSKHLGSRQTLLILDNCEHLIDACARLADALLNSCSGLRVLATSREALGIAGETNWPLSPLSLPEAGTTNAERRLPPVEKLARYESIRLFVECARSRLPDFELNEENVRGVVEVCRNLDGIPLGIELACARLSALAVEQIVARLNDSLRLLTTGGRTADPRHRTLRATLEWSYELLDEPEHTLFGRLSVFAGGWMLEAAEDVCSDDAIERDDVLDLLARLVDKSLVVAEAVETLDATSLRYRMLEPVRQYALERLEESGEIEEIRKRHASYYLGLAERVEPELYGPRPASSLELLHAEHGNLSAALSWVLDAGEHAEMGLRMAAALGRFWDAYSPAEGRRWLEKGLASSDAAPASVRAKALNEAGLIAVYEGDPKGMVLLEESLALYKKLGDRSGMASAMSSLGHAVVQLDNRERMLSLREEAQALLSEPLDRWERAHLLVFMGLATGTEFDFVTMKAQVDEALALFRELEDIRGIATCLPILGYVALAQDDPERAATRFEEGLHLQRELKQKTHTFMCIHGMGAVAHLRGQPDRAAKLIGASNALWDAIGLSLESSSWEHFNYQGALAAVRARLDEAAFEAAFSEGQAMSTEEAIEYALGAQETSPQSAVQPPRTAPSEPLTRREREVALLIGRGYTNAQIANALAISKYTVANHVARILRKLDLPSRSQIAVWVTEKRLRDPE